MTKENKGKHEVHCIGHTGFQENCSIEVCCDYERNIIDAAPELLEACKEAYEVLKKIQGGLSPAFNAAYACSCAIAKAEGKGD